MFWRVQLRKRSLRGKTETRISYRFSIFGFVKDTHQNVFAAVFFIRAIISSKPTLISQQIVAVDALPLGEKEQQYVFANEIDKCF